MSDPLMAVYALLWLVTLFGAYTAFIYLLDAAVARRTPPRRTVPYTCSKCGLTLWRRDQLAVWRAYVKHYETSHQ